MKILKYIFFFVILIANGTFMDKILAKNNTIIPRKVIFSNPDKTKVKISPDGNHISYLAPKNKVLNIYVAPKSNINNAVSITNDKKRGIRLYFWAYNNEDIIYLQDNNGDENWNLYKANITTHKHQNLISLPEVQIRILKVSFKFPNEIMIGMNKRKKEYHDVYKLNIKTGKLDLVYKNDKYTYFIIDDDFKIRFMERPISDGGREIYEYANKKAKPFLTIPKEDTLTTYIMGFDKSGENVFLNSSLETNTAGVYLLNTKTKEKKFIFDDSKADVTSIMQHPTEKNLQAVSYYYKKKEAYLPDPKIQEAFGYLQNLRNGEIIVNSRALNDNLWIVSFISDTKPTYYYLFDKNKKKAKFLFTSKQNLESYKLAHMHPLSIPTKDGFELVSYLTLPTYSVKNPTDIKPIKPVPMILLVHGGPNARDYWGMNQKHQWLANRGYAVLSVNYRGSTGFGKKFINAGNGEWAEKMQDDLIDSVKWAIKNKITQKDKVAIMGVSYGGYATLVGLTFTPDFFACGVDIVGPSNLITLLNSVPPYWKPMIDSFILKTGGDPNTQEGRKILKSKSPITKVTNIKKPLLIGQGANDPRVKQSESDQIVKEMEINNIPVIYALYPDEGHGFARPENNLSFFAITEAFLSTYLHGKFEPISNDFNNTSLKIEAGKKYLPKSVADKLGK